RLFDTSSTVTGMVEPSSANTRVMPTLRPTRPRLIFFSKCPGYDWPGGLVKTTTTNTTNGHPDGAPGNSLLQLDFDVHASRQIQLHQGINGLVGRIDDVHQAQMGTNFVLVARGLVHMRGTQYVGALDAGRQRNRATNNSTGALRGIHDFKSRLIDQTIVESLQADTDFLTLHDNNSLKNKALAAKPTKR